MDEILLGILMFIMFIIGGFLFKTRCHLIDQGKAQIEINNAQKEFNELVKDYLKLAQIK